MAGPLSSEEIEDVVSSVRRLVSNELSPRRLSRDLGADRLLLTPALRVVSEISPLAPLVLGKMVEDPVSPEAQPVATEGAEPLVDDAVPLIEAEWEDEIWVAPEATAALGEVALGVEDAEVLVADGQADEPLAVLAGDTYDDKATSVEAEPQQAVLIPIAPLLRRTESRTTHLPSEDDDSEPAGANAPLHGGSAEQSLPVDDVHQPTEAWSETTQPEEAVDHGDAVPDADTAEDLSDAALQDNLSPRMPTEIIDADGTPLAVLDEAALQEIVRQMIREELQGDLGERITRNVRKLVRAEINRALMARDLD
ncbi:hypothetical protein [Tabrizicola sp.]|uniref:hypothetical protein n=1 Tax=Tabrizicola sp. TaxID=2005166 RepID=UPI002AC99B8C|nr:hypothetical protein [Tabrizicola sp.]